MAKRSATQATSQAETKGKRRRPRVMMVAVPRAPSHDQIAQRAFSLYVQRGAAPGTELSDWFQAEAELKALG